MKRRFVLIGLVVCLFSENAISQKLKKTIIIIQIENRRIVAPQKPVKVFENDLITLRFLSDKTVNLHLHGYNRFVTVFAGTPADMILTAKATGRFPISSHGWGTPRKGNQPKKIKHGHDHGGLTYLEVYPR